MSKKKILLLPTEMDNARTFSRWQKGFSVMSEQRYEVGNKLFESQYCSAWGSAKWLLKNKKKAVPSEPRIARIEAGLPRIESQRCSYAVANTLLTVKIVTLAEEAYEHPENFNEHKRTKQ